MISAEHFRKHQPEAALPVLSDEAVRLAVIQNISTAAAITEQTSGLAESRRDATKEVRVFYMDADEELSDVANAKGEDIGRVERGKFQDIAFVVLTEYGLRMDSSAPKYTNGGFDSNGCDRYNDETTRQLLRYPSTLIS
ncbi:MAG: hypothetical protein M1308_10615 [Actinobacteria bacterium]|nr:hypothetical protein [Actinomycetota bacterium]